MNEILTAAADLIEQDGWCQGSYGDGNGRHCALGAIRDASVNNIRKHIQAVAALRETIGVHGIAAWNDDPERTQTEVVAALRKAAQA